MDRWNRLLVVGVSVAVMLVGAGCGVLVDSGPKSEAPQTEPESAALTTAAPVLETVSMLDDFNGAFTWLPEKDWGDAAKVTRVARDAEKKDQAMDIQYTLAAKKKVVVGRDFVDPRDLSGFNAVMLDVDSKLPVGCFVAVGLSTTPGRKYVEGPPVHVAPGRNKDLVIRLDEPRFKSAASEWAYTQPVGDLKAVQKILILLYPIPDGRIQVDNLRLAKFRAGK